ncbi:MAG: hypothetical protein K8I82_05945 [Anaerolineae bacterium]|nr:hypothetical protein [Anaerolineae bacterium]
MSIFFDEWRNCLREHYRYVLYTQDWITEKTLREVLMEVGGFSEDEIYVMYTEVMGEETQAESDIEAAAYSEPEFIEEEPIMMEDSPPEEIFPQEEEKPNSFSQGRLF